MNLHPWQDVLANADKKIADGWTVYQQFNCEKCGQKQTMPDENKFFMSGRCEECDHVTDIVKNGMNFMATKSARGDAIRDILKDVS
jgi:Zn finger protein HypA/HybF involved in hydrogenase expression